MKHHIAAMIQKHDIILFDAVCVICNGWANFLITHDQNSKFKLASAQSALGEQILQYYGMSTTHYTTMVVILNGQLYTESTALLKVMQHLGATFLANECRLSHSSPNPGFSLPACRTQPL
jgi:predicted DCC family thiol-disulfide oxidoreductase YuxK